MVQRLATTAGRLDGQAHLLAYRLLADVIRELLRADRPIDAVFLAGLGGRGHETFGHLQKT